MNTHPKSRAGFTLAEILVAMSSAVLLLVGIYYISNTTNILSVKCFSSNITGTEARNALDMIYTNLQEAYTIPIPINSAGVNLSGSTLSISNASTATAIQARGLIPCVSATSSTVTAQVTGTGAGIAFYRLLGGPYLLSLSSALTSSQSQVTLYTSTNALIPPPRPQSAGGSPPYMQAGDILLIYTTANQATTAQSGASIMDFATVSGTASISGTAITVHLLAQGSGNNTIFSAGSTAGVDITMDASGNSTTPTGINTTKDSTGNYTTPTVYLLRPTAFVIVSATTANPQLIYIDSYASRNGVVDVSGTSAGAATITALGKPYSRVLSYAIEPSSNDSNQSAFGIVTIQSTGGSVRNYVGSILHMRAKSYENYLNWSGRQNLSFSTFMGVNSLISLKSYPN